MDEDKANYSWQANYGSRPVFLIDSQKGTHAVVGGGNIAQEIDVNWLPGIA
ncbi:hypothetical protein BH23VER1_BH23VER1_04590 [soil metagenome]